MNNNLSGKPMDGQARQVRDLDRVDDDVGDCNMKSGLFRRQGNGQPTTTAITVNLKRKSSTVHDGVNLLCDASSSTTCTCCVEC